MDFGCLKKPQKTNGLCYRIRTSSLRTMRLSVAIPAFSVCTISTILTGNAYALDPDAFGRLVFDDCNQAKAAFSAEPADGRQALLSKVSLILSLPPEVNATGLGNTFGGSSGTDALARRENFDQAHDLSAKECAADLAMASGEDGYGLLGILSTELSKVVYPQNTRKKLEAAFVSLVQNLKESNHSITEEIVKKLVTSPSDAASARNSTVAFIVLRNKFADAAALQALPETTLALLVTLASERSPMLSELLTRKLQISSSTPVNRELLKSIVQSDVYAPIAAEYCLTDSAIEPCDLLVEHDIATLQFATDEEQVTLISFLEKNKAREQLTALINYLIAHGKEAVVTERIKTSSPLFMDAVLASNLKNSQAKIEQSLLARDTLTGEGIYALLGNMRKPSRELLQRIQKDLLSPAQFENPDQFWKIVALPYGSWNVRIKEEKVCDAFWTASEPPAALSEKIAENLSYFPESCLSKLKGRQEQWAQELVLLQLLQKRGNKDGIKKTAEIKTPVAKTPMVKAVPKGLQKHSDSKAPEAMKPDDKGLFDQLTRVSYIQNPSVQQKFATFKNDPLVTAYPQFLANADDSLLVTQIPCENLFSSDKIADRLSTQSAFAGRYAACAAELIANQATIEAKSALWQKLEARVTPSYQTVLQAQSTQFAALNLAHTLLLMQRAEVYPQEICKGVFAAGDAQPFELCKQLFVDFGFTNKDEVLTALNQNPKPDMAKDLAELIRTVNDVPQQGVETLVEFMSEGNHLIQYNGMFSQIPNAQQATFLAVAAEAFSLGQLVPLLQTIEKLTAFTSSTVFNTIFSRLSLAAKKDFALSEAWNVIEKKDIGSAVLFILKFDDLPTIVSGRTVLKGRAAPQIDSQSIENLLWDSLPEKPVANQ